MGLLLCVGCWLVRSLWSWVWPGAYTCFVTAVRATWATGHVKKHVRGWQRKGIYFFSVLVSASPGSMGLVGDPASPLGKGELTPLVQPVVFWKETKLQGQRAFRAKLCRHFNPHPLPLYLLASCPESLVTSWGESQGCFLWGWRGSFRGVGVRMTRQALGAMPLTVSILSSSL